MMASSRLNKRDERSKWTYKTVAITSSSICTNFRLPVSPQELQKQLFDHFFKWSPIWRIMKIIELICGWSRIYVFHPCGCRDLIVRRSKLRKLWILNRFCLLSSWISLSSEKLSVRVAWPLLKMEEAASPACTSFSSKARGDIVLK